MAEPQKKEEEKGEALEDIFVKPTEEATFGNLVTQRAVEPAPTLETFKFPDLDQIAPEEELPPAVGAARTLRSSSSGAFVLPGITQQPVNTDIDETLQEENVINSDLIDRKNTQSDILFNTIQNIPFDERASQEIADEINQLVAQEPKRRSVGSIYVDTKFADIPPVQKQILADGIDTKILYDKNVRDQAAIFDEENLAGISTKEFRMTVPIDPSLRKAIESSINKSPFLIAGAAPTSALNTVLGGQDEATVAKLESLRPIYGDTVTGLISFPNSVEHFLGESKYGLREPQAENVELRSIQDALNFVNIIGVEGGEEFEFLEMANYIAQGQFDTAGDEFARVAESKWGPNWGWRLAAFALKEVGVDAALIALAAAFPPLGVPLLVGKRVRQAFRIGQIARTGRVALGPRMAAAMGRAVYVGIGGGAVQAGLNVATGRPNQFLEEAGFRVLGFAGAELLVKGFAVATKPLRRAIKNTRSRIAAERQVLEHRESVVRAANNVNGNSPAAQLNLLTLLRLGHIFAEINRSSELRRMGKEVTDAIMRKPGFEEVRKNLTQQLGVEDSQLEVLIPHALEVFRNVKTLPSLKAAQRTAQQSSRGLVGAQKTAESLKNELKRTITFHERHPLKAGARNYNANVKKRRDKLTELKSAVREANKTVKELKTARSKSQATITELEKLGEVTSGSQLADAIANSEAIGTRVMMGAHLESSRQQAINDVFTGWILGLGRMTFRNPELEPTKAWKTNAFSPVRLLGDPVDVHALRSLPRDLLDADNRTKLFRKLFLTMYKSAFSGLNVEQKARVFTALDTGSEKGVLWTIDDLLGFKLSPKEIDAYYGVRKTLDFAHYTMDEILVKQFQRRQVMRLPDGRLAQVLNTQVPKQFRTRGGEDKYVNYRVISPVSSAPMEESTIKFAQLRPIQSVLDLEQGYIPITYRDARYHVSEIDLANGTHSRIIASPTRREAIEGMRRLQKEIDASDNSNRILYTDAWDDMANKYSYTMHRRGLELIDTMDDKAVNAIKRALDQAIRRDPNNTVRIEQIRVMFDRLTGANLRKRFVGARTQRLEAPEGGEAPRLFTEEAIPDYLSAVAERSGLGEWRDFAIDTFMNTYVRPGAPRPILPTHSRWYDPIPVEQSMVQISRSEGVIHANPAWVSEARAMQDWLKRTITFQTSFEKRFDDSIKSIILRMAESNKPSYQAASKALDRFMPSITKAITGGRAVSGATKLLFFNVGQFIVQASQIIPTLGVQAFTRPQVIGPAFVDLARAIGAITRERAALLAGKSPAEILSKQDSEILNAIRRSGWFEDISTSDIVTAANLDRPAYSRLVKQEGALQAAVTSTGRSALDIGRRIYNVGAIPFKMGEGSNRAVAFALVRREFMWRLKNGQTVLGLDQKPLGIKDIDSDAFIRAVVAKASRTALNMTRPGQVQLFSGLGSLIFQFKQVLPKSITIFATKDLTAAEKFGALSFYLGFWGPVGIPLMSDLFTVADAAYWRFTGKEPDKVRFFRDWGINHAPELAEYIKQTSPEISELWGIDHKAIEKVFRFRGAVFELTQGEIDLVNRIALGKFFSEMVDNMNPQDLVVFFSVVVDGYNALLSDGVQPSIFTTLEAYYEGQLTGFEAANKVLANVGKVVSTAGYVSRFIENNNKELFDPSFSQFLAEEGFRTRTIKSSSGRDTGIPIEGVGAIGKVRLYQYLFGLTPGPIVTELERVKAENEYRVAVREYIRAQADRYVRAHTSDARIKIMAETIEEAEEAYPLIAGEDFEMPLTKDPRWIYQQIFGTFWREWLRFSHGG